MFELALRKNSGLVLLKDIARNQGLSEKYLSKLIIPLKSAGLVSSARGFKGGYEISKDPSKVTIKEILEALEGKISIAECVYNPQSCCRSSVCPTRDVWVNLTNVITEFLGQVTLSDVIDNYKNKVEENVINYSI